jgi:uncharacterized metal-binding protein (TIGR02443 family)
MTLKRFIAGAVCPQCQLQDKIVVYQAADTAYCECVRCGYRQQQPTSAATPPAADVAPPKPVKAPSAREHVIRLHKKNSSA